MMPIMGNLSLRSAEYLVNFLPVFDSKCIAGITVDEEELTRRSLNNPALATLLNRKIGYLKASEIAKESASVGRSVKDLVIEKGLLTKEEADEIFDKEALLGRLDRS